MCSFHFNLIICDRETARYIVIDHELHYGFSFLNKLLIHIY